MSSFLELMVARFTVKTLPQAVRIVRIVVGFTVLIIGLLLLVTPGPAIIVIPIGLAILAGEFVWARRLVKKFNCRWNNRRNRK